MLLTDLPGEVRASAQESLSVLQSWWDSLPAKALHLGVRVLLALIMFVIGYWLIRLVRKLVRKSMKKARAEYGVTTFVDSFLKVALYVILIFMIAASFGVDAASIVALLGSAGVAIGLAIQGSLSNLAGGVLILLMKPFVVGDYIEDSASGKEGRVTEITIFYTHLKTYDNQTVILPNGNLSNAAIVNRTREDSRRVDIKVSIAYSASMDDARAAILEAIGQEKYVLQEREKLVAVSELGDSGVQLVVRCWTHTDHFWDVKFHLTESIKKALDAAGVEIPFPQIVVHKA